MTRSVIKIIGIDRESFLQSLITNDIKLLKTQEALYTCLLNPKGRYNFDFFLIKKEDGFLVDIDQGVIEIFLKTLKYRKLIAKVDFQVLEGYKVYHTKEKISQEAILVSYQDTRLDILGFRTISNKELPSDILIGNYDELRYQNCIPEGEDFIFDKTIPIEFGLDELNSISYNKGCYLGQEFTNSAKNRMEIRRRLITIISDNHLSFDDNICNVKGELVGKIISSYGRYHFVLFKMSHRDEELFVNGNKVEKVIPKWIKIYSLV